MSDASELTGKALDPTKFSDVITAIHAVQEEMGITGTTSKEASTTIEGSINSMKAAWENWTTGLGRSDVGIEGLTDQLIDSVATVAQNVIPRIGVIASSLVQALPRLFGSLASTLGPVIAEGLAGAWNMAANALGNLGLELPTIDPSQVMGAFTEVFGFVSEIAASVGPAVGAVFSTIGQAIQTFAPVIGELVQTVLPPLVEVISSLVPPLMNIVSAVLPPIAGLIEAIMPSIESIMGILTTLVQTVIIPLMEPLTQIVQTLLPPIAGIIEALMPIIETVLGLLMDFLNTVILPLVDPISQIVQELLPPIAGLLEGLQEPINAVVGFLQDLAGALSPVVDFLGKLVDLAGQAAGALADLAGGVIGGVGDFIGGFFATGGFTAGPGIVGEDPRYPTEAVISFNPAYRAQNLRYWAMAGHMLGASSAGASRASGASANTSGATYDFSGMTFAPKVEVRGNATQEDIVNAIRQCEGEFVDFVLEALGRREEAAYA